MLLRIYLSLHLLGFLLSRIVILIEILPTSYGYLSDIFVPAVLTYTTEQQIVQPWRSASSTARLRLFLEIKFGGRKDSYDHE